MSNELDEATLLAAIDELNAKRKSDRFTRYTGQTNQDVVNNVQTNAALSALYEQLGRLHYKAAKLEEIAYKQARLPILEGLERRNELAEQREAIQAL